MDKERHPTELTTTIPSEEMGRQIMGLRYDLLWKVLMGMLQEATRQAKHDTKTGRVKLARALYRLAHSLNGCMLDLSYVTEVCHKYITREKESETATVDSGTGGRVQSMAPRADQPSVQAGSGLNQGVGSESREVPEVSRT